MESLKKQSQRIVNGHIATANQFPHQVSVLTPIDAEFAICGGSIISMSWVLTAAHCTQGAQVNLRFGSLNLWTGGIAQTSFRWIKHPQFDYRTMNFDISLIRLSSVLQLTNAVQHVRLPRAGQINQSFLGMQSTVSGWGNTGPGTDMQHNLRWAQMQIISNTQCGWVFGQAVIASHVMCTLGVDQHGNQSHCSGDSGGPLIISEIGVNTLVGVVSFGAANGCHLGYPSGSMRTAHFVHWIAAHTRIPVRSI